jgi:hypothetical protein
MRILITLLLLSLSLGSTAQIKFFKLFTNNGGDRGQGVIQMEDSSYVLTGSSSSFEPGPSQAFLLHIDSMGNYLWSRHYGGPEIESGRRVLYKKNFGYFICGYTNSIGAGGYDMYLAKVKEDSDLEWERAYGGTGWEQVHDAAMCRDTGVIMVGETSSNSTDNKDFYIVRTNKFGDTLWTKTFGGAGDDFASAISVHDDSMFVIVGRKWNNDSLMTKAYCMYMKEDGTILWQKSFGPSGEYWLNDVFVEASRVVAVGGTQGPWKPGIDFYFCPVDYSGNLVGPFEWPVDGDEDFGGVTGYGTNGNYYVASHREDAGSYEGGVDMLVQNFQNSFAWVSGFGVSHIDPDIAGEIIRTNDGAAFVVGYTTGVVSGGNEIFALKIGPDSDYPDTDNDLVIDEIVTIEEQEQSEFVSIYPNPAGDWVQVHVLNDAYDKVRLLNAAGQRLEETDILSTVKLNLNGLSDGVYFIEVESNSGQILHYKLLIHH